MACKKVTNITDKYETHEHLGMQVPNKPWDLGKEIQLNQPRGLEGQLNILLNKGRYYDMSTWDNKLAHQISWIMSKKKFCGYNTFCGPWHELETLVSVCNSLGYYCTIKIDWI